MTEEVSSIEINEKQEPIVVDEVKVTPDVEDPRMAIYNKHKEQRAAEIEGTPVGVEPGKQEVSEEVHVDAEEVTVKVHGKEKKVKKSKVDEAGGVDVYQKRLAAEEDMKLAATEKRRLAEYEAQLTAKARQLQQYEQSIQQRAKQQPATSPPDAGEMKQLAKKYHEAILDGDIDQADELLLKLQGARTATPMDADVIARKAVAEAKAAMMAERRNEQKARFESERKEAVARFESEYSDIAENPELREWADQKTIKIMQANPDWTPTQIIDEAARQVREATGMKASPPSSKTEAKRTMTTVRGGSARAIPKAAPKPASPSQYVENLRRMRGLE